MLLIVGMTIIDNNPMMGCAESKKVGAAPCGLLASGLESKPMNSSLKGAKLFKR